MKNKYNIKFPFTTKTRVSTIQKTLREAGWTEDQIKSYIRGWDNVKNKSKRSKK